MTDIEKVARAMAAQANDYDNGILQWECWRDSAQAAIAAMQPAPQEPVGSAAEITRLTEALCFIGKWVERGVFDKQISARESLEVIINLPGMPWNSDRWDVDHKPYAAAYYARFPAALKGPSHD